MGWLRGVKEGEEEGKVGMCNVATADMQAMRMGFQIERMECVEGEEDFSPSVQSPT